MKRIYSYIEVDGATFRPPAMVGPDAIAPEYLMQLDGRHYVAVEGELPSQHPAIELRGPHQLNKEPELRDALAQSAEPMRAMKRRRAEDYPAIGDQLDALINEFAQRRARGEALTPELDGIIDRCLAVKNKHPKPDIGLP